MNTHKNARLTYLRRLEIVKDMIERGFAASEAAAKHGVSAVTARKWHGRYLAGGAAGAARQVFASSASRRALSIRRIAETIVELRRKAVAQAGHRDLHGCVQGDRQPRTQARRHVEAKRYASCRSPSSATNTMRLATCCTSTSRSWAASTRSGHRITGDRASASSRHWLGLRLRRRGRSQPNCVHADLPGRNWQSAASLLARFGQPFRQPARAHPARHHRQRKVLPFGRVRRGMPREWASPRSSLEPSDHRPMARPSDSSSRPCANGPTDEPTRTPKIVGCLARRGITSTTGIVAIMASAACHPCRGFLPRKNVLTLHS